MNVNIGGKGLIPGLRMLAPVKNVDLDQQQVARILKVKTLKVTLADSPDIITMNNIAQIFANQGSVKVAAPIKKKDAPKTKKAEKKVEEKAPVEALIEKAESVGIETELIKEEETPAEAPIDDITLAEGLLDEALEVATTAIPAVEEEVIDESEDTTEEESEEEAEEAPVTTENQNSKKKNKKNRHNK